MQVQFKTGQTEALSSMYILVKEHWTASLPLLPCSLPSDCKDPIYMLLEGKRQ